MKRHRGEEAMQAALVLWVRNEAVHEFPILAWLFHCPNGGARNPVVAGQMVALGVRKGVPDLLLPIPAPVDNSAPGLAIECKSDDGRLSSEQVGWLTVLSRAGWQTHIVRSLDEGKAVITAYAQGRVHAVTQWKACANDEGIIQSSGRTRGRRAA
jgi:hypothetical protein